MSNSHKLDFHFWFSSQAPSMIGDGVELHLIVMRVTGSVGMETKSDEVCRLVPTLAKWLNLK